MQIIFTYVSASPTYLFNNGLCGRVRGRPDANAQIHKYMCICMCMRMYVHIGYALGLSVIRTSQQLGEQQVDNLMLSTIEDYMTTNVRNFHLKFHD